MAFGLLNINKPAGPTSHDIVAIIRRGTGERQAGHTGTLDPLADGVLVVALGKATRLIEFHAVSRKVYVADFTLGIATTTYDMDGDIVARRPMPVGLTAELIRETLAKFEGTSQQVPPAFSAIKVKGKTAYSLARAGIPFQLEAREITVHRLELLDGSLPVIRARIECSAGTYVRSLAHDIGEQLGCGAALSRLTRHAAGVFHLENATDLRALEAAFQDGSWENYLLRPDSGLEDIPIVRLDDEQLERLRHEIGRAHV